MVGLMSNELVAFGSKLSNEAEEVFGGELADGVKISVLEALDVAFEPFVVHVKSPEIRGELPAISSLSPFSRILAARSEIPSWSKIIAASLESPHARI
jgi:hypothetical protein